MGYYYLHRPSNIKGNPHTIRLTVLSLRLTTYSVLLILIAYLQSLNLLAFLIYTAAHNLFFYSKAAIKEAAHKSTLIPYNQSLTPLDVTKINRAMFFFGTLPFHSLFHILPTKSRFFITIS